MAKIYRKHLAHDRVEVAIDGEPCTLITRRPSTRDTLALAQLGGELRRSISSAGLDADAYGRLICALVEFVVEVEGLVDEEGASVSWADLNEEEREGVILDIDLTTALDAFNRLANAGRLNAGEKKASEPTSPPSSAESDADAPSAPEASPSPA